MAKARSRAAKRKRIGRMPKAGPRYQCGKLVQPTSHEREAAVTATVIDARMRIYHVSGDEAMNPLRGYALGRLHLDRKNGITAEHLEAGNKMAEDFARYYRLTGIPFPSARAQNVLRLGGEGAPVNPIEARSAANKVMALEGVLGGADEQGRPVTSVIKRLILADEDIVMPHMVVFARRGLDALVKYYG